MAQGSDNNSTMSRERYSFQLEQFSIQLEQVKILYDQYFLDTIPRAPEPEHKRLQALARQLRNSMPQKADLRFRAQQLIARFHSFEMYWNRTLRERENGTYKRDVFKAKIRKENSSPELKQLQKDAKENEAMFALFEQYRNAVEKSGKTVDVLQFFNFKETIGERSKKIKQQAGTGKLRYKIVTQGEKVSVQIDPVQK